MSANSGIQSVHIQAVFSFTDMNHGCETSRRHSLRDRSHLRSMQWVILDLSANAPATLSAAEGVLDHTRPTVRLLRHCPGAVDLCSLRKVALVAK